MPRWEAKTAEREAFTEDQIAALTTRSEQTFRQVGGAEETGAVLYTSTNSAISAVQSGQVQSSPSQRRTAAAYGPPPSSFPLLSPPSSGLMFPQTPSAPLVPLVCRP